MTKPHHARRTPNKALMLVGLAVLALMALISPAVLATTPDEHGSDQHQGGEGDAEAASQYTPVQLEGFGNGSTIANAVNDHGVAVGSATARNGKVRPVSWDADGNLRRLDLPRAARSGAALDVNNRGEAVGSTSRNGRGGREASDRATFWEADGSAHRLRSRGDRGGSIAHAVNEHGTIVGEATDRDGTTRAVIWEGGRHRFRDLGAGDDSKALDINDDGDVVGVRQGVAFVIHDGQVIQLGTKPSAARTINSSGVPAGSGEWTFSRPNQIATWWLPDGDRFRAMDSPSPDGASSTIEDSNDTDGERGGGDMVGSANPSGDGTPAALFWPVDQGVTTLTPLPDHEGGLAHGINEHGVIVGASLHDDTRHATIWRP